MNLLAHLYLADHSATSLAGQILGDEIKGRLEQIALPEPVVEGIRLHRRIDAVSDAHAEHAQLRAGFDRPLRRYAPILVDIGLDHALACGWAGYHEQPLAAFAHAAQRRLIAEWPMGAPFGAERLRGLAQVLAGYAEPAGLQRALDSVARRLRRPSPVAQALPALLARRPAFERALGPVMQDLAAAVAATRATGGAS